ncbi:hypothetical protein GCM10009830_08960 [Glycomyces endophyticus]|uniref:VWFA domain-containing protein n=1 Tax=Glycomyces endophyticus TaxID=480996 RepID=A0ABN2G5B5_9ACTN
MSEPSRPEPAHEQAVDDKAAKDRAGLHPIESLACGAGFVLALLQFSDWVVEPRWRPLLALGGMAIAIAALTRWSWTRGRRKRWAYLGAMAAVCAALVVTIDPPRLVLPWNRDCADPVSLTVLLPEDGAIGFEVALTEFNAWYTEDGCRRAEVTAYDAPWPAVEKALAAGWAAVPSEDAALQPLRDVGPRPDLWIAESRTQVEAAAAMLGGAGEPGALDLDDSVRVGTTPLVVAVPAEDLEDGFNGGSQRAEAPLPDLIDALGAEYGTPVLRPDPMATHAGVLFLRNLYGEDAVHGGVGARLENQLVEWTAAAGNPLPVNDTALLCQLSEQDEEFAALVTEASLARYNEGGPLGADCALRGDRHTDLVPVYGEDFGGLDYQAARFEWADDPWSGERGEAAAALQRWLADAEDWNLSSIGVRDNDFRGGQLFGDVAFDEAFAVEAEPLGAEAYESLRVAYSRNRPPTDVLLAIDRSGTMSGRDGGASRFELATAGVEAALRYLGEQDRAGLWTFPMEGVESHYQVLGIGQDASGAGALLADTEASHGVDLHQVLVDGAAELEAARTEQGFSAMVVLTDGADLDTSPTTADQVLERLDDAEVNVYLIAVGDASCRSAPFDGLDGPRVTCLEAREDDITATFDGLFDALWSGDA